MRDNNPSPLRAAVAHLMQLTAEIIKTSDSNELRALSQLCAFWDKRIGDELVRRHLPPRH
jgi:hypothetical protein